MAEKRVATGVAKTTQVGEDAGDEKPALVDGILAELLGLLLDNIENLSGTDLGPALIRVLDLWLTRYVRSNCGIVVLARSADGRSLVEAQHDVASAQVSELDRFSLTLGQRSCRWEAHTVLEGSPEGTPAFPTAGLAVPLGAPNRLGGHLILLHPQPFLPGHLTPLVNATRLLSFVTHLEQDRQRVSLGAALFRHSLLGPVQGLTDAALYLAEFPGMPPKERELNVAQIRLESESIRFWSATQRLMRLGQPGVLELRPRKWPLKKLVDSCVNRYRNLFESRGIRFVVDWRERGSVEFEFDVETLDLAVSNLLHNAAKYAFFNRDVTLGAGVIGEHVQIWVEDVGHPIPAWALESLSSPGRRYVNDPLRAIPGEGMGLYMVRKVVEAHHGRIRVSCERERSSVKESGSVANYHAPYRVRIVLELPHHWQRKLVNPAASS